MLTGVTAAVKVTVCPIVAGFGDEVTAVAVPSWVMLNVTDVLLADV